MSAIAGIWYPDGRPGAAAACARINQAQQLYGPHREALWDGGEMALGHRQMRFLPEDRFDRQPLLGRGGRLALVADARIDNRAELGAALGLAPAQQAVMCDAAFILAALERWNDAALDHLVGDFAFAAWDSAARRLLLARDHLDGRPLHYHVGQGWFGFASMPKGLLALPDVPTGPDPLRLIEWQLLFPLTGPRSFMRGVSRLEPGHLAIITADGRISTRRYWQPENLPVKHLPRSDDYADGMRDALDRAVQARLRSNAGIGMMLSGGLDSTAVATSAAPLLAAAGRRLTAFTSVPLPGTPASFKPSYMDNEAPLAGLVAAQHPNIDHHLVQAFDADLVAALEKTVFLADQPAMNPTNTAWADEIYRQATQRKLDVVLTGTRGNMALTYTGEHLPNQQVRQLRFLAAWRDAGVLVAAQRGDSRVHVLRSALLAQLPPRWRAALRQWRLTPEDWSIWSPLNPAALAAQGLDAEHWRRSPYYAAWPRRWQDWAMRVFSSMDGGPMNAAINAGYGVDRRDPTGDRRLLEFCLTMPLTQYLRNGRTKDVFRRAFRHRLPEAVLHNPKRGLQAADWRAILLKAQPDIRQELARQTGNPACGELVDLADLHHLAATLEQADSGKYDSYRRHHLKLTRGLSSGLFIRRASGGNS